MDKVEVKDFMFGTLEEEKIDNSKKKKKKKKKKRTKNKTRKR